MTTTSDDSPEWLTRAQFAAALQVHPRTVSRWVTTDATMRVKRLGPSGRFLRIHRSELERRSPEDVARDATDAAVALNT